MYLIMYC